MAIFLSGAPGSQYAIRLSGNNTTGVLGRIAPVSTSGRDDPPQPYNGFDTSYSPFGNGHVFALSLGGTDERRNLVPQWEQWQQSGAWRNVETDCERFPDHIFCCTISYNDNAMDGHDDLLDRFQGGERLVEWFDSRLPTRFVVSVHNLPGLDLDAIASDADYERERATLTAGNRVAGPHTFDVTAMPVEDRRYWVAQMGRDAADAVYDEYIEAEETAAEARDMALDRRPSFSSFTMFPESVDEIRVRLGTLPGVGVTDAAGWQVNTLFGQESNAKRNYRMSQFKSRYGFGTGRRKNAATMREKTRREKQAADLAKRRGR